MKELRKELGALRELDEKEIDQISGGNKPQQVTYYQAGNSNQYFTEQHGNKTPTTFTVH